MGKKRWQEGINQRNIDLITHMDGAAAFQYSTHTTPTHDRSVFPCVLQHPPSFPSPPLPHLLSSRVPYVVAVSSFSFPFLSSSPPISKTSNRRACPSLERREDPTSKWHSPPNDEREETQEEDGVGSCQHGGRGLRNLGHKKTAAAAIALRQFSQCHKCHPCSNPSFSPKTEQ